MHSTYFHTFTVVCIQLDAGLPNHTIRQQMPASSSSVDRRNQVLIPATTHRFSPGDIAILEDIGLCGHLPSCGDPSLPYFIEQRG